MKDKVISIHNKEAEEFKKELEIFKVNLPEYKEFLIYEDEPSKPIREDMYKKDISKDGPPAQTDQRLFHFVFAIITGSASPRVDMIDLWEYKEGVDWLVEYYIPKEVLR